MGQRMGEKGVAPVRWPVRKAAEVEERGPWPRLTDAETLRWPRRRHGNGCPGWALWVRAWRPTACVRPCTGLPRGRGQQETPLLGGQC